MLTGAIAGVGGVHLATLEADFVFPISLLSRRWRSPQTPAPRTARLLVPECPHHHHLISACTAASEGSFSVHIGQGDEPSYIDFGRKRA